MTDEKRTTRRTALRQIAGATLAVPAMLSWSCRPMQATVPSEKAKPSPEAEKLATVPTSRLEWGSLAVVGETGNWSSAKEARERPLRTPASWPSPTTT